MCAKERRKDVYLALAFLVVLDSVLSFAKYTNVVGRTPGDGRVLDFGGGQKKCWRLPSHVTIPHLARHCFPTLREPRNHSSQSAFYVPTYKVCMQMELEALITSIVPRRPVWLLTM